MIKTKFVTTTILCIASNFVPRPLHWEWPKVKLQACVIDFEVLISFFSFSVGDVKCSARDVMQCKAAAVMPHGLTDLCRERWRGVWSLSDSPKKSDRFRGNAPRVYLCYCCDANDGVFFFTN